LDASALEDIIQALCTHVSEWSGSMYLTDMQFTVSDACGLPHRQR